MKLLLVDDNTFYLSRLTTFLQSNGIEVLGTANDGLEALIKVEMLRPEIILMDIEMGGCGGIEATRLIKKDFPEIEIVMLSISDEDEHLFEAIRAGASGYLLKNMDGKDFLTELRRLVTGDTPLAPGFARRILQELAQSDRGAKTVVGEKGAPAKEPPTLTARQSEILNLLAQGQTYKEIGKALQIQQSTVKYHMNEILSKLHLANRAQLIAYAANFKK